MVEPFIFGGLFALIALCSLMVVVAKTPVNAIIFLIMDLIFLAGVFAMLEAHFAAVIQVILYAGAIVILFLFVVMVLQPAKEIKAQGGVILKKLIFSVFGLCTLGFFVLKARGIELKTIAPPQAFNLDNTKEVATLLYEKYPWPFELASILILMAVVGCLFVSSHRPVVAHK